MILRILFDQNIPPAVCEFVRKRKPGWSVRHVNDVGLHGAPDDTIFRWAQRMYPAGLHAGVVRLRVWPTTIENTETALARLFDSVADDDLPGSLVIVDEAKIRVRRGHPEFDTPALFLHQGLLVSWQVADDPLGVASGDNWYSTVNRGASPGNTGLEISQVDNNFDSKLSSQR